MAFVKGFAAFVKIPDDGLASGFVVTIARQTV